MKKGLFLVAMIALFVFAANAQAQNKDAKKTKFTAEQRIDFRVARMQKRLMLDEAAAKKFAPIYKDYLSALAECRVNKGKPVQKGACLNLTDEQIKENIENCISADVKRAEVKEKYYKKLSKVLSARQLQVVFCKKEANGAKAPRWNKANKGNKRAKGVANGRKGYKRGAGRKVGNAPKNK